MINRGRLELATSPIIVQYKVTFNWAFFLCHFSANQELQNTTADNFANATIDVRVEAQITFNG